MMKATWRAPAGLLRRAAQAAAPGARAFIAPVMAPKVRLQAKNFLCSVSSVFLPRTQGFASELNWPTQH